MTLSMNCEIAATVAGLLQAQLSLIHTLDDNLVKFMDRESEVQTFFLDS